MSETQLNTESLETLRLLYPIFKEEVYRRRAKIAQIARQGALVFTSFSILRFFLPTQSQALPLQIKLLGAGVVVVAVLLMVFQMVQEKARHEKAKLQLITLERAFGFFDDGRYLPNKALYPSDWQDRPNLDTGLAVSIAGLCGSGLVLMFLILSI